MPPTDPYQFDPEDFARRLSVVRERIAAACAHAQRSPDSVRLLPVTKGFGPEAIEAARDAGLCAVGENRVQEAAWKRDRCAGSLEWHLIGHLQRNKARLALERFDWLQAVDSIRLIETLERMAQEHGFSPSILLEINVSGESSKFGLSPDDAPAAIEKVMTGRSLTLMGLMTMAPFSSDPEQARPYFSRLRQLRDRWQDDFGVALPTLSMGMSNDFEVAIACGATCVRIGSALFGPRPPWSVLQARMQSEFNE